MDGKTLRKLRKAANLTQEQLGSKIGISGSAIRMIELGKRKGSAKVNKKLAEFFNIPEETLINPEKAKQNVVSGIIDQLISTGAINNPDNITEEIKKIILFAAQTEVKLKLEDMSKNKNNSD